MSPAEAVLHWQRRVDRITCELSLATMELAAAARRAAGFVRADQADVQAIIHEVAEDYGILPAAVLGRAKPAEIAEPRKIAMYLARELTPHPLHTLGRAFARDHGMICHAVDRVEALMSVNAKFRARIERLRAQCLRRLALLTPKEASGA